MAMTQSDAEQSDPPAPRPKLFLSYTRADADQAASIRDILERRGFEVWWDQLLESGVNYLPTTEAALEAADAVVVLWSKLSVDSAWVRDEAQRGRERGCLVPVSLDGTISPLGFRQIQLLDLSGWTGSPDAPEIERLVTALRNRVAAREPGDEAGGPLPAPTPSPPPSPAPSSTPGLSRRALIAGGIGIVGAGAAFAGWRGGLFAPAGGDGSVLSMAVLRFANLTGDEDRAWFSNGLSNELRQELSRNPRLRVSAPTSSNANAGQDDFAIGNALGVTSILRGTVQQVDETIRIFAELLQIDGGVVLWSESYDRAFEDVLAVQSEIAETVALSLVARVAGESRARASLEDQEGVGGTENVRAYEAYLRGQSFVALAAGEASDRAALGHFDAAIQLDPDYAAAHAMRANMLAAVANAGSEPDEIARLFEDSIAAAERAIAIAPDLAAGHLALGYVRYYGQTDRSGAYPHYKRAEELAPGDADTLSAVGIFYAYGDQQALAMEMSHRVLELDPLNALAFRSTGYIALFSGEYEIAIERMERALELNPELVSAHYAIGVARFALGDVAGARDAFAEEPAEVFGLTGLAIARRKLGDAAGAEAAWGGLLAQYGESGLYQQAQVLAQWGEKERALAMLQRAFDEGDPGVLLTTNDPLLDPLRGEPAMDRLLLRLAS
jgi:TolB-like protein/lipoprotein NlpI